MNSQKIRETIIYSISAALCFIVGGYSILSFYFIRKLYPFFGIVLIFGITLNFFEFLSHILFLIDVFMNGKSSILSLASAEVATMMQYIGTILDIMFQTNFLFCVYEYLPWGEGDDAFFYCSIFFIVSIIKLAFLFMVSFNVRSPHPYFLNSNKVIQIKETKLDDEENVSLKP